MKLPYDFTLELPPEAKSWLLRYGITNEEQKQFHIGWTEKQKRVILPVYDGENLVYYQGRALANVSKENPKYLNIRQKGAKDVFFRRLVSGSKDIHRFGNTLCVVEDILSAIKCGRYTSTLALLGSYVPDSLYKEFKKYDKVYFWLDADKYTDAVKYMMKVSSRGTIGGVIKTVLDPKEESDERIRGMLEMRSE